MSVYDIRPVVLEAIREPEFKELRFQSDEYDRREFFEVAASYGWDTRTVESVWAWFQSPESRSSEDRE